MLVEAVRASYAYGSWANERVFDAAEHLTPEQLLAPGSAGRGSIRDTLVHLVFAHKGWLVWWDGSLSAAEAYGRRPDLDAFPSVAAVREAWAAVDASTQAFLANLTDQTLAGVFENTMPNGMVFRLPLWQMMLHVANHGTQHRSEVAAMLTAAGHSPGDLDMLGYFRPFGDATRA